MAQLSFDWTLLDSDEPARDRFLAFHHANPHVMAQLAVKARMLKDRGFQHYGIAALWEVLRYDYAMQTDDPTSQLKLNDNYKPFYAREIMRAFPDLQGFFTTRRSQADD